MATAMTLGHRLAQMRAQGLGRGGSTISRASRPESSALISAPDSADPGATWSRIAMAADLLAQTSGDRGGLVRHFGRVHAAWPGDRDRELLRNPARSRGEQHHAVAEAHCLTDVVGHEQ